MFEGCARTHLLRRLDWPEADCAFEERVSPLGTRVRLHRVAQSIHRVIRCTILPAICKRVVEQAIRGRSFLGASDLQIHPSGRLVVSAVRASSVGEEPERCGSASAAEMVAREPLAAIEPPARANRWELAPAPMLAVDREAGRRLLASARHASGTLFPSQALAPKVVKTTHIILHTPNITQTHHTQSHLKTLDLIHNHTLNHKNLKPHTHKITTITHHTTIKPKKQ